jgi:hypothetical protein
MKKITLQQVRNAVHITMVRFMQAQIFILAYMLYHLYTHMKQVAQFEGAYMTYFGVVLGIAMLANTIDFVCSKIQKRRWKAAKAF